MHRLLHTKYLYKFHRKHHTMLASVEASALYMSPFDVIVTQVILIVITAVIIDIPLILHIAIISIGTLNAVHSHGDYSFPLMPPPNDHLAHHLNGKIKLGIDPSDWLMGTTEKKKKNILRY